MSFTIESNSVINSIQKDARRLEIKMTKKPNLAKIKIHLEFTIKKLHELKEELKQRNTDFENDINKFDSTIVLKNQS
ncbi:MAG: hypothetical protein ABI851_15705 [Saprospiraceae bacterium]